MSKSQHKNLFTNILNVIGLSVAFAAFIIILIQVNFDLNYNKCIRDHGKVFRVEGAFDLSSPERYSQNFSRPLVRIFGSSSPDIESFGEFNYRGGTKILKRADLEDTPFLSIEVAALVKSTIPALGIEIVAGDTSTFDNSSNILISQSSAKAFFADESPLGKVLRDESKGDYTIIAVYKDFPENCSIKNGVLFNLDNENYDNWSNWNYNMFVRVYDVEKVDSIKNRLADKLVEVYKDDTELMSAYASADFTKLFRLTPIAETHFTKDVAYDWIEKASKATTFSLLTIAFLIIIIAIINFINFSMASIPLNIKGINTRKVLGCTNTELRLKQIGEATILSFISLLIAFLWIFILSGTSFSGFISGSIALGDNIPMLIIGTAVALITGIAAGIYPAVYSTSFPPAMVVKGTFSLSPKGRRLRKGLVALQYVISLILIMTALFINVQSSFMKNYDMGYDTDNILTAYISTDLGNRRDAFAQRLKENPAIEDVTFSAGMIISNGKMGWGRMYKGEHIQFDCFPVATNFISFFGMEMEEGRAFTPEDEKKANGTMICNRTMLNTFPFINLGDKVAGHSNDPSDMVGIIKDFNFQPLHYRINPIALYNYGLHPWSPLIFTYIKLSDRADVKECISYIRSTIKEMDPNFPEERIDIVFMEERISRLYQKEDNLGKLILAFCALSVLISIIGILGLIYFETQFKKREIGVRRVFGSSVFQILKMLNLTYIRIATICWVISVPVSILIMKMWLKTFTYQAPIPVWIFLTAYAVIILITILIITLQSIRSASANPVDSVRAD